MYSKKCYYSNFGDKISSKDKIISIAQTHNHVKENSIPLLRYCVVEDSIKAEIEKAKDENKEENKESTKLPVKKEDKKEGKKKKIHL